MFETATFFYDDPVYRSLCTVFEKTIILKRFNILATKRTET